MENVENMEDELPDIVKCSVEKIYFFADPFSCWANIDSSVTLEEIQKAVDGFDQNIKYEDLKPTQAKSTRDPITMGMTQEDFKEAHIQKIAYFVLNGVDMKIQLDVGVAGYDSEFHMIEDGNHRLAAAIFRGDKSIDVEWAGDEERMRDWGLLYQPEEKSVFKMK